MAVIYLTGLENNFYSNSTVNTTLATTGGCTTDTFILNGQATTAAPPYINDWPWQQNWYNPPTTVQWIIPNSELNNQQEKNGDNIMKRLVEVFVVDPNKNVPDDKSLVHHVTPFLTSETDEEIKMGLGLKEVLKLYNEYRVGLVNEDRSEGRDKDVHVKKAKLSDLVVRISCVEEF